jgi:hypothetical protein
MPAEAEVRTRIDRFVSDLTDLIRSATVEVFEEALEAQRAVSRPTGRWVKAPRARVRGAGVRRSTARDPGAPAAKRATKRRSSEERSTPAQLSLPLE